MNNNIKKKTILFVAPTLEKGGMEHQLSLLLFNIVKEYKVYLALYIKNIDYDLPNETSIIDLKRKTMGWDPFFEFRLFYTIINLKPDLIYSTLKGVNNYCQVIGSILRIPVIASIRSIDDYNDYKKIRMINSFFPFKQFICNTSHAKKQLHEYCNIHSSRICVIPNGIDTNKFNIKRRDELKLCFENEAIKKYDNCFKLIFVGRIIRIKNIHLIIEALSKISHEKFIFVIIGKVWEKDYNTYCIDKARKHNIYKKIFWENQKKNIEDYYNWADCLVLPSCYEGTSNVLLEAMSCGLPVIVSENADVDHIVVNGVNGYRFNPTTDNGSLEKRIMHIKSEDIINKYKYLNSEKIKNNYSLEKLYRSTKLCIQNQL